MSLSSDELNDLRLDLAANITTFPDAELQRLYDRTGSYNGTLLLAVKQLLMNATKFTDYTAGQTAEKRSNVFSQLLQMYEVLKEEVRAGNQARIVGMRGVPTPWGETPIGQEPVDEKQRRSAGYFRRRWGSW